MNLEDDSGKNTRNANLKAVARFVMVWSVLAIISVSQIKLLANFFGAFFELFGANDPSSWALSWYALGYWEALSLYGVGFLAGFLALKYPLGSGALMVGDGLVGLLFGGLVARVFGLIMIISGGICIVYIVRARHPAQR